MEYEKITVTLNPLQIKDAIREKVRKDFPNHHIGEVTWEAGESVVVVIEPLGPYASR